MEWGIGEATTRLFRRDGSVLNVVTELATYRARKKPRGETHEPYSGRREVVGSDAIAHVPDHGYARYGRPGPRRAPP